MITAIFSHFGKYSEKQLFVFTLLFVIVIYNIGKTVKKNHTRNALVKHQIEHFYEKRNLIPNDKYICYTEAKNFISPWAPFYEKTKRLSFPKRSKLFRLSSEFFEDYESWFEYVKKRNDKFVAAEIARCKALFSDIDGKSLDEQQQTVVVTDEDHNLVLAGAGSGKTLTIAAKVKYLCQERNIHPKDILLIAFTKKSAQEMTERISDRLKIPVRAITFHKLGKDIINSGQQHLLEPYGKLSEFVIEYFEKNIFDHPDTVKPIIEYFAYYFNIPSKMENFSSLGRAFDFERSTDFETLRSKYEAVKYLGQMSESGGSNKETLKGERVKSIEELTIANFLFLKGIDYKYEPRYPYRSPETGYKVYRPDFYLPKYKIYVEHFGVNKNFRVPWLSPIEEMKYIQGIFWKREFHRQNGTCLLETYSHYSSDGILLEKLESMLKENGVIFNELSLEEIFNVVLRKATIKNFLEFMKLCDTFIVLFKSNGYSIDNLYSLRYKTDEYDNPYFGRRTQLFLEIIYPLFEEYERYLKSNDLLDFSDMINEATKKITGGHRIHPYRYVIIDEYQDISIARYKLVKAILDQTKAKLLCVGDDWQSIYRFAGADNSLFSDFTQYFGKTAKLKLEQTYRNSQELINEAGKFIMKNPIQQKKDLVSSKNLDSPIAFIRYDRDRSAAFQDAIDNIISEFGPDKTILLLGRTSYDIEFLQKSESAFFKVISNGKSTSVIYSESPETPILFLTIHKAKGLESDNVILLNFENATLGFPNKISDDPVLYLVLSKSESFMYAEERRLLYVALTRTKNKVYILVNDNHPSEFFTDFKPSKSVLITNNLLKNKTNTIFCPYCMTGKLIIRGNPKNHNGFIGCTNYPQCDYTVNDISIMINPIRCPKCGGFLIKRAGFHGPFWGCSYYPTCKHTADYLNQN